MFNYSHFPAATDQKETLMSASRWRCLLEESQQEFCCCFNYSLPFRLTGLFKQEKKRRKKKRKEGVGGKEHLISLAYSLIFPTLPLASLMFIQVTLLTPAVPRLCWSDPSHWDKVRGMLCTCDADSNFLIIMQILAFYFWNLFIVTLFFF